MFMNFTGNRFFTMVPLLMAMALVAGCGGGADVPDDLPELVPYSVKVTYKGANVEGADVLFAPTSGQYSAAGRTDASGVAVMKTNGQYEGVPVAEYRVSVTKIEADAVAPASESATDPKEYAANLAASMNKPAPKVKNALPEKYSSFDKSELKVSVSEGGAGQETIELVE